MTDFYEMFPVSLFTEVCQVGVALMTCRQMDRLTDERTHVTKLIGAFQDFVNTTKSNTCTKCVCTKFGTR
jgi:hypothetical protein